LNNPQNKITQYIKLNISRQMVVLIAIVALSILAWNILGPVLPLYLTSIGVTPQLIGLIVSVAMVGMVVGESTGGWMADKIGIKTPLIVGTFFSGLSVLCFVFTQNITSLFIIFFFWGLFRSAVFGPVRGYIGINAPVLSKATFMAFISVVQSASSSIGALPSGFLADNLGYRGIFFISCGISAAAGVLVLYALQKARPIKVSYHIPEAKGNDIRNKLIKVNYRPFIVQCLVAALQFWGWGASLSFLALLANQVIGASATRVGVLFTAASISGMLLSIPMGIIADRIGRKNSMILGMTVSAISAAGIAFSPTYLWLMLFAILGGLGTAAFTPAALGMVSDSVPANRQSTAMGFYGAFGENIGIIAGGSLSGFIWSAWGPSYTFIVSSGVIALGILVCTVLVKNKDPWKFQPTSEAKS
jgi:MFS transporter, PPP family, 3-phenylpropionic acid transporter